MSQDALCKAYCSQEPVPFICEGCRIVRCPHVVDVLASPKGGSVEENPNSGDFGRKLSFEPKIVSTFTSNYSSNRLGR